MHKRTVLAAVIFAAAPSVSIADPFWLYDRNASAPATLGQFYISANVWGGVQQLPRFQSTVSVFTANGVVPSTINPDLKGAEPGGAIGYVFRDGTLPAWIGQRVRVEFGGNALTMNSRDSRSFQTAAGNIVVINGIGGTTFVAPAGLGFSFRLDDDLRVERDGFRLHFKVAADRALSPNLSLTPSIAVHGGHTSDAYKYTYVFAHPATGFTTGAPGQIDHRLRTSEIGVDFGGVLNWQFAPGFTLNAGGTLGVLWMRTRLSGQDCFNNNTAVPIFTPCGPSNVAFFTSTVSDSRSTVGFRGTAQLGVSADLRVAVATLGGFFRYDSRIPGVDNPNSQTPAANTGTARVRFDDGFAYGGYLVFRVPISGL